MNISMKNGKNGHRKTSQDIVVRLNEMIRHGEIMPGGPLPANADLAKMLGVSGPTLSTRLRSLTAAGILRSRQGSGTFVVEANKYPSDESAPLRLLAALHGFDGDEIFEARLSLEMCIARMAAERATAEHLTLLMEEIIGMYASLDNTKQFFEHLEKFHQTMVAAANNRILSALFNMVVQIHSGEDRKSALLPKNLKELTEFHHRIFRALRERNQELASETIRTYLIKCYVVHQDEKTKTSVGRR